MITFEPSVADALFLRWERGQGRLGDKQGRIQPMRQSERERELDFQVILMFLMIYVLLPIQIHNSYNYVKHTKFAKILKLVLYTTPG